MVQVSSISVFASNLIGPLAGISDLDMALFSDQWTLFATHGNDGSIGVFDVLEIEGPAVRGTVSLIPGDQFSPENLDFFETNGELLAFISGEGSTDNFAYRVSFDPATDDGIGLTPATSVSTAPATLATAEIDGRTVAITSHPDQDGFTARLVATDFVTVPYQTVSIPGSEIADIELISLGSTGIAIAIDRAASKIMSYAVHSDGLLTYVDALSVADGLGLINPEILRLVDVAGHHYGIVAAGISSSISVFEIEETGEMTARDHVIDGQQTRFAAISELEVIEANGRAFILSAGADDGITLFELLPDGRLLHHTTIEDTDALSLKDVSGLTGKFHGGTLHIFAASATEAGLTELTVDLGAAGVVQKAGNSEDTLTGGAGDDVLFGGHGDGADVLLGNEGDDILIAGHGADRLAGGPGADIFVFGGSPDGGQIDDFDATRDTLDLSGWFTLHDVSQLEFSAYGNRADIAFLGYTLSVYSHDGSSLNASEVAGRITINPGHSLISEIPDATDLNDTHTGSAGDDVLFGSAGEDLFRASGGADVFIGGSGFDVVSYERAGNRIIHDQLFSARNKGVNANDTFYSIEGIKGTKFGDVLLADNGDNLLEGGNGGDVMAGRNGADELFGDGGDDKLFGGYGYDSLYGGAGNDLLRGHSGDDLLVGGDGDDALFGEKKNDIVIGGDGRDTISGGGDDDELYGDAGNDRMNGNFGNDSLYGGQGHDLMRGYHGDDLLAGDAGNDALFGEKGNDTLGGGAGNDRLTGGAGADEFHFTEGQDRITDFSAADIVFISGNLLDDPAMTASEVLEIYGRLSALGGVLDFGVDAEGNSQKLILDGVRDLADLADSLFVF